MGAKVKDVKETGPDETLAALEITSREVKVFEPQRKSDNIYFRPRP